MTSAVELARVLATLPKDSFDCVIRKLSPLELRAIEYEWSFWARPEQLAPAGAWDTWLLCTGIGFGKTRSGAEWIRACAESGEGQWMALVGATAADVRDTMIEGESGILAISPPWFMPVYEPSKRRLTWPNGAIATCFSAEEPDRLRGPNIDRAWADELAAWARLEETWRNLEGRMRRGADPRVCVTTTPRPLALLRELAADPHTRLVRGSTRANAALLPERYKRRAAKWEGTEYGRQEIEGEILDDRQGAVFSAWWKRALEAPEDLRRVVIGVDVSTKDKKTNDETGIIAAGVSFADEVYVLGDYSGRMSPAAWARAVLAAYDDHAADAVIVETNRGGDMIRHTIRTELKSAGRRVEEVPIREVHASRGKVTRAEPIAALYQQKRVTHVGAPERFARLEREMVEWDPASAASPNRVDALVWAITHLDVAPDHRADMQGMGEDASQPKQAPEDAFWSGADDDDADSAGHGARFRRVAG